MSEIQGWKDIRRGGQTIKQFFFLTVKNAVLSILFYPLDFVLFRLCAEMRPRYLQVEFDTEGMILTYLSCVVEGST